MSYGSSNNMDIHVDVTDDDTGSEDIEMETHEIEQEQELELELEEVLRNKIKKELKRRGSTSACKPPQPEVSVLGRRHKLDYVEWLVRTDYDEKSANMLIPQDQSHFESMFEFYASSLPWPKRKMEGSSCVSTPSASSVPCNEVVMDVKKLLSMKYKKEKETLKIEKKSELDKYLCDECEHNDETFEILLFWKDQKKRYPIFTMMAPDVLAMPVSTVASESAFSTRSRVLDSFRTSLTSIIVEALICA